MGLKEELAAIDDANKRKLAEADAAAAAEKADREEHDRKAKEWAIRVSNDVVVPMLREFADAVKQPNCAVNQSDEGICQICSIRLIDTTHGCFHIALSVSYAQIRCELGHSKGLNSQNVTDLRGIWRVVGLTMPDDKLRQAVTEILKDAFEKMELQKNPRLGRL